VRSRISPYGTSFPTSMVHQVTEYRTSMSVPLDSDGFLRRECPTCEREFKWLPTPDGEEPTPAATAGLFCPYCAVQADPGAWFTKAQIEQATAIVYEEVVAPELEDFKRSVEGMNRSGLIGVRAELKVEEPDPPPELEETDDMRRVDFPCHPGEPVKVLDSWVSEVHCLVCGIVAEP
jgi:hypothetical protein